jgi:hypothetical protein
MTEREKRFFCIFSFLFGGFFEADGETVAESANNRRMERRKYKEKTRFSPNNTIHPSYNTLHRNLPHPPFCWIGNFISVQTTTHIIESFLFEGSGLKMNQLEQPPREFLLIWTSVFKCDCNQATAI